MREKTLLAEIRRVQAEVAAGKIDLRPIGEQLNGYWSQDFIADVMRVAEAALTEEVRALE